MSTEASPRPRAAPSSVTALAPAAANPDPPAAPLLDELRAATRALHATLDASLGLDPAHTDRARYAGFLRAMQAAIAPLEAAIAAVPGWADAVPDAPHRQRAALLDADLQTLAADGLALAPPLAAPTLPALDSLAAAFGASYVLEGSTLGGVVLARSLGPALGLTPAHGLRYWTAHGGEVGPRWRAFLAALERWAATATAAERTTAVATAVATFGVFLASAPAAPADTATDATVRR